MQVAPGRRQTGRVAFHAGEAAEACVARAYQRRGLQLAATRWRGTVGEIDLIFRDGNAVVFVEVKKSASFAAAAVRVRPAQQRRIFAAAEEFICTEPQGLLTETRFDIALVNSAGEIDILENALQDF
jgi:putative endonuclease